MHEVVITSDIVVKYFKVITFLNSHDKIIIPLNNIDVEIKNAIYNVSSGQTMTNIFDKDYEYYNSIDYYTFYISPNDYMIIYFDNEEDAFYFKLKYC